MKKVFLWALLIGSIGAKAQNSQAPTLSFGCRYYGGNIDHSRICHLQGFISSNKHAEDVVDRILKPIGLNRNFVVMECPNIDNCFAATMNGVRYVVYDKMFFRRVENKAQTDWAAISILAHEVGHHLQGHTVDGKGSRPDKELEADKFSGFVLHQMGASLKDAQIAMKLLQDETGTSTHPARSKRLKAIEKGWLEAEDVFPTSKQEVREQNNEVVTEKTLQKQPEQKAEPIAAEPTKPPVVITEEIENKRKISTELLGCIGGNCVNGRGVYVHESGEKYDGNWAEGKRNGYGVHFYANGELKYEGMFEDDLRDGKGEYHFKNGDYYEGTFLKNRMNGFGIYHYANGDKFEGMFVNDKRNGKGRYVYGDGRIEVSNYINDSKSNR